MHTDGKCGVTAKVVFFLAALGGLPALAEGYVTLTKSNSYKIGFAGAEWSEEVADPSTRDYLVSGSKTYYYTKGDEVIPARSLTIGVAGGAAGHYWAYYSATYNHLIFANGECYLNKKDVVLSGTVTFASPASEPFELYGYDRKTGFEFPGTVHSGAGDGIVAYSSRTNGFYVTFSGDTSDYLGSVVVTSQYDTAGVPLGAEFRLSGSASNFGGSITVRDGATFCPKIATSVKSLTLERGAKLSREVPLTVGDLTFAEASLSFTLDETTLECTTFLDITNSFTCTAPGKIAIEITNAGDIKIPPARHLSIPLFSLPAGSGCDENSFEIVQTAKMFCNRMLLLKQDDGDREVYSLEVYPQISRELWPNEAIDFGGSGGDDCDATAVSLNSATNASTESAWWEDGLAPHANAHYRVDRVQSPTTGSRATTYVRTPYLPDGSFAFPGESLVLAQSVHLVLMSRDFHVGQLVVASENQVVCSTLSDTTFHGEIYTGTSVARFYPGGAKLFTHDGNLVGSAGIAVTGRAASNNDVAGKVYFAGTNTEFTGTVDVSMNVSIKSGNLVTPRWNGRRYVTLYVANPLNLGAPRAAFAADALSIRNMCELSALEDVEFADQTRGVSLDWIAQLTTPESVTMTMRQPMAFNATVYKNGEGTLALGGSLSFRDGNGDLTGAIPADATNRTLQVTAGTLKVLAARSIDGLDVVFARNANVSGSTSQKCFFELDPCTEDVELAQYGAINLKAETPFALGSGQDKVEIVIPAGTEVPDEGRRVPICTVKASAAEEVAGVFKVNRVFMSGDAKFKVAIIQKSVTLDDTQAVTIEANITPPGGAIILIK